VRRAVLGLVFVCLVVVAVSVQANAQSVAREALELHVAAGDDTRSWQERLTDARAAVELRPDILAFRKREASIQAARYVEIGALDKARLLLIHVWGFDRTDSELRSQLRSVNRAITARDSRKAHILHGREKPGGVLEPDDLMP